MTKDRSRYDYFVMTKYGTVSKINRMEEKRGRPSLSGKTGDSPKLQIRLTAEERAAWEATAKRAGFTLSEWLRNIANHAAKRAKK